MHIARKFSKQPANMEKGCQHQSLRLQPTPALRVTLVQTTKSVVIASHSEVQESLAAPRGGVVVLPLRPAREGEGSARASPENAPSQ